MVVIVCYVLLKALEIVFVSILLFLLFVSYHWYAFCINGAKGMVGMGLIILKFTETYMHRYKYFYENYLHYLYSFAIRFLFKIF